MAMGGERRKEIEAFIETLPDPSGARMFLDRLEELPRARASGGAGDSLLLSRLLTIAAYSPFLAETLLRNPEYIDWLKRESERDLGHTKSVEELSEDLARFAARMMNAEDRVRLAGFKRRELLRIYLRDCLGVATLSEVTEELSSLADVILSDALAQAHRETVNKHGAPQARDERGRIVPAEFAIVSLGKLGCRELNYASDIDLLFLYSGKGETAGVNRRPESVIDNKAFFTAIARRIVQMIGGNVGDGSVYRIDLRLRPYGRDGDLVWEVGRASDYYRGPARNWERQALIRARASAGSDAVAVRFLDSVRDVIFQPEALPNTLAEVRRSKEQIDRKMARRTGGFNVKLGPGGIREIEFIAQALQLAHGGQEPWVRSAQTLIVLARLAEKGYLSEAERARLSSAYTFLRTVEHRLQMEQGVQTHSLPLARDRLETVARRSGYQAARDPAADFRRDLETHTANVRAVYNRIFIEGSSVQKEAAVAQACGAEIHLDDETERLIAQASAALGRVKAQSPDEKAGAAEPMIAEALASAINPIRSLRNFISWAESLATYDLSRLGGEGEIYSNLFSKLLSNELPGFLKRLMPLMSSQYISHILISRPMFAAALGEVGAGREKPELLRLMRSALDEAAGVASKTDCLRRMWYRSILEISHRDITGSAAASKHSDAERLRENNREQTALAEASLEIALEIALESLRIHDVPPSALPFAIMALGRLGHTGMDYGSDMDLLVVFDEAAAWPPPPLEEWASREAGRGAGSPQEFYARLTSQLVRVLSAVTREGFLYRIDLRLRPEGKSGPTHRAWGGLLAYLESRASAWEHSAYLKAREVAGDPVLGARARALICNTAFDAAARDGALRENLTAMRARLEKEKARGSRQNIKWGRGGMTDVYFITRYLQLRDRVYFPPERGTTRLIEHLGAGRHLDSDSTRVLLEGYGFLRRLDHWLRLLLDRPGPDLPASRASLEEITRAMGFASVEEFELAYARHTSAVRAVYEEVMRPACGGYPE